MHTRIQTFCRLATLVPAVFAILVINQLAAASQAEAEYWTPVTKIEEINLAQCQHRFKVTTPLMADSISWKASYFEVHHSDQVFYRDRSSDNIKKRFHFTSKVSLADVMYTLKNSGTVSDQLVKMFVAHYRNADPAFPILGLELALEILETNRTATIVQHTFLPTSGWVGLGGYPIATNTITLEQLCR